MAIEYVMPKLAMAMNEGTVNEWLVQDGQYVEKGQDLATVETEKVAYDLESPEAGYFRIVLPPGETVRVETLIGLFAETEEELASLNDKQAAVPAESPAAVEQAAAAPAAVSPAPHVALAAAVDGGKRLKVSPLARKMARDQGLDLALVAGTGPGGRIVKRDIQQALQYGVRAPVADAGPLVEKARIPFKGLRATIAERMLASQQSTASLSSGWESDITDLLQMRKALVAKAETLGTKVSVNALLIRALVYAIRQVPIANAALIDGEIRIYDSINVAIAVSVPGKTEYDSGLMVPVLKGVEKMGLVEIDKGMKALVDKVRSGGLDAQDLVDSTITLSSTAGIAPPGLTTAPVLNLPNAVIVGPSTPKDKPVVVDGEIRVRTLMPLSMTFDHRILDGEPAARFMRALHECLESPELMLA
jgi:pyruvate/2-oxoglutarate dehydrogenase complex dihydrolipoamide acyltransferase (E2) component